MNVFIYTQQSSFPLRGITNVRIDSTVEEIPAETFCNSSLCHVQLNEGLGKIGKWAFQNTSLITIVMPSTLWFIGKRAFEGCRSLVNVQLNDGLQLIHPEAFAKCYSLERINIPSTIRYLGPDVFAGCQRLEIEFSEEIQELVTETSLQEWWNGSATRHAASTSVFLTYHCFKQRLAMLQPVRLWLAIDDMLGRIPSEHFWYFDSIEKQLTTFEKLEDAIPLLELALWKAKLVEQSYPSNDGEPTTSKMEHRFTCGAEVIIPNVLSFIIG
jgi:hypothetical protein